MSATHPTRLETRTKESNTCASQGLARKPPWRNEGLSVCPSVRPCVGRFRTSPPHLSRTPAPPPTHTLPCPLPSCVCVPRLSPGTPTTTDALSLLLQISNLAPSPLPHPRPTSHTHTALSFA
ncbi:hypothetical protein MG293_020892 [Ovis ammon polii]|uniref:Uncharacterized protein n=1 Tax=Ovis ammon polii TaxID=230172 RepID=A0AAD4TJ60_OVIAM|nr:hypothetical protein MG293_020892 [Ovis ammon polii]